MIIGIDSGSTMCKGVLFNDDRLIDSAIVKTAWNPKISADHVYNLLRERNGISGDAVLVSTGYGREAIENADFSFTEISCHAQGGSYLVDSIEGIIDIGGQDSKVIQVSSGKVLDFFMNDKCAAGTGRFLNMACNSLEIDISEIDDYIDRENAVFINSMCTVFAESEIIGLLSQQKDRRQILAGVLNSIANKVLQMSSKIKWSENAEILFTGGLSQSKELTDILKKTVNLNVRTSQYSPFAGAIGACVLAGKKL